MINLCPKCGKRMEITLTPTDGDQADTHVGLKCTECGFSIMTWVKLSGIMMYHVNTIVSQILVRYLSEKSKNRIISPYGSEDKFKQEILGTWVQKND